MIRTLLLLIIVLFSVPATTAQVTLNQVDDFQDGTTQEWRIGGAGNATNGPINVPNAVAIANNVIKFIRKPVTSTKKRAEIIEVGITIAAINVRPTWPVNK